MRKTKLPKREVQICHRLREAREFLGLTQARCAQDIGLERATLQNHELCRTPLRCDVALRFCRRFLVSEEWLATGQFGAARAALDQLGLTAEPWWPAADPRLERGIMLRQCVDLFAEPAAWHVSRTSLFSTAYDGVLAPVYRRLAAQSAGLPRVNISDGDTPELGVNVLTATQERFIALLNHAGLQAGNDPRTLWGVYVQHMFRCSAAAFRRLMHMPRWGDAKFALEWLSSAEPDATGTPGAPGSENPKPPTVMGL